MLQFYLCVNVMIAIMAKERPVNYQTDADIHGTKEHHVSPFWTHLPLLLRLAHSYKYCVLVRCHYVLQTDKR